VHTMSRWSHSGIEDQLLGQFAGMLACHHEEALPGAVTAIALLLAPDIHCPCVYHVLCMAGR
jgi:hypothetical protein